MSYLGIAVIMDVVFNHAFGQSPPRECIGTQSPNRRIWIHHIAILSWAIPQMSVADRIMKAHYEALYATMDFKQYLLTEYQDRQISLWLSKGFTLNYGNDVDRWVDKWRSENQYFKNYANQIWASNAMPTLSLNTLQKIPKELELSSYSMMLWGKHEITITTQWPCRVPLLNNNSRRMYFASKSRNGKAIDAWPCGTWKATMKKD